MDLRLEAMNKLNGAIPNLNANINSETGAVQENTKAWEENFKRLQDYYELEGARAKLAELGRKKVDAILRLQQKEDAYANTNVDVNPGRPVTSGGAVMGGQAQGAIGQAGQKAAAKRERDKAQQEYNDIIAQEDALYKKFGAKLDVKGKKVGGGGKKVGGGGGGNAEAPEDDSRANISEFITKINNFYERQKTAMIEKMTEDGVEKDLQDYAVEKIENRLNAALAAAKQSLVLGTKAWDDFKASMDKDLKEKDDEYGQSQSRMLKDAIQSTDVMKLRSNLLKQMPKIKKGQMVGLKSDERDRAYLDRLWLEESKSEDKQATIDQKQAEQRRKELLEHDYTGIVQQNSFLGLAKTGFVDIDINEIDRDRDTIIKVLEKARNNIVGVFQTGGQKDALLKFLFGENYENMPMQFLSLLDASEEDVRLFYQKLIQYNDEYESASKKGDDERKKLNDYGWSKTDFYKDYQSKLPGMEQEASIKGSYRNAGQRMGMESVSASDPELELMKARMEFAQRYYTFLEEHNATEQQLADARKSIMAEQANYAKKLTGDMFEQYNSLLTFMGPLQTFGESVGDAFATMTENAAEGRKALKTALKQMIKAFATNTLQMISQQQIDRAQTTAHYTQLLLMQQAFAQAKLQAEVANGTAMIGAQQANNLTEEQLEGIHQKVMAALRLAGIFGWCVSTLGPIAGPIAYSAMMATLMGLLNFAISKIGGSDNSKNENAKGKNTKVVSGMLTYDSGNVQDLRPFVGNDGSLYWATEDNKPHDGVSLLTQPTATTINGQPSLVAENGPELVIGRETTQAMMMNNPQLLKALVNYDRNYSGRRAYDTGNVAETSPTIAAGASVSDELTIAQANTNVALLQAVNTLLQRLEQPIEAKIDMYGRGKLYDSMTKANQFMKNK